MEETKQIIAMLVQKFVETEQGNKVTSNNMIGFMQQIFGALDGEITLQKPAEQPQQQIPSAPVTKIMDNE
jgi:hypothetical protein